MNKILFHLDGCPPVPVRLNRQETAKSFSRVVIPFCLLSSNKYLLPQVAIALGMVDIFYFSRPDRCEAESHKGLKLNSLMTNDVESLSMCLFII